MRIGLLDVDGHNFPNLALMKLSAWHKAQKDQVEWYVDGNRYDRVYVAKVFTNSPEIKTVNSSEVVFGGSGFNLTSKLPDGVEHQYPDYSVYPAYSQAYGHMTRGCPRNCKFCIVAKKEGLKSVHVANLSEFWRGQAEIKLIDPNLLACKEHETLLHQLIKTGVHIDFTQGLDARKITADNAWLLSKIKVKMVHFAFDSLKDEKSIIRGLNIYKIISGIRTRKTGVYILTNFDTSHEEDVYRVKLVQDAGFMPYIMIYEKDSAPKITRHLQRWCNNRIIYHSCTFNDYLKKVGGGVHRG
jgi:hypothetical protein